MPLVEETDNRSHAIYLLRPFLSDDINSIIGPCWRHEKLWG